jgi:hypothetical protein
MPDLARLWARPITLEPPPPTCLVPRQTGRGAGANGSKQGGDKRKIDATVSAVISAINSSPLERSDCICHGNLGNLLLVRELMDDELRAGISSGA